MPPSEVEWYDNSPDLTQFYQGDILQGVPFPTWPTFLPNDQKMAILRPLRQPRPGQNLDALPLYFTANARSQVENAFVNEDEAERVVGKCRLRSVMIMTRGCQLDHVKRRKYVVVAPVTYIADLPEVERSVGKLAGLQDNEIPHQFYLPGGKNIEESFADFLKMTAIHRSFLHDNAVREQLVARLSSVATMRLQQKLSEHFGKQFGFDHLDECPQDGLYSCSTCFHSGNEVSKRQYRQGMLFGPCELCGEEAAFVKIASLADSY